MRPARCGTCSTGWATNGVHLSCSRSGPARSASACCGGRSRTFRNVCLRKRCATCNAIERLTRETVERLGEKKVGIRILEIGQNEELAEQYGVTWSSLLLVRNDTVKNLTRTAFELAKSRPETFKARLTEAIEHFAE